AQPNSTEISKAIVMGRLNTEDTDWVSKELSDWQSAIYVVNLPDNASSPTGRRTKINKAREAMPYLTYIIDTYPDFPDVMAFIHAHRKGYPTAWHTDANNHDAVDMLRKLRLGVVMERGYVNLRCTESPGCPVEILPWRSPADPEKLPEHIFPFVYAEFFNRTFAQAKDEVSVVATPCCAQFAVSKEQILKHTKHEYERWRRYLEFTSYSDAHIGRVLEYMWHIMFGQEAVHCPNAWQCFCDVYGQC
ncbi:hypothetical protein BAUCODRAFT_54554, partial [Baudoinia panamericana UAMH 10762]